MACTVLMIIVHVCYTYVGLCPSYLLLANGTGGFQYYFHIIFQSTVASPLSDTKVDGV